MRKIFLLGLIIVLSFSGCEQVGGKKYVSIDDQSQVFKVRVLGIFPEDDTYSLYYTTDGSIDFTTIPPIYQTVAADTNSQEIVFSLPEQVMPAQLRLDFGVKPHPKTITLKLITLSYKGRALQLPGTLIFSYFTPDFSKTDFNPSNATIVGVVKNGMRQTPSLYPKQGPLSREIKKILE